MNATILTRIVNVLVARRWSAESAAHKNLCAGDRDAQRMWLSRSAGLGEAIAVVQMFNETTRTNATPIMSTEPTNPPPAESPSAGAPGSACANCLHWDRNSGFASRRNFGWCKELHRRTQETGGKSCTLYAPNPKV
jgi:hypothetical protein